MARIFDNFDAPSGIWTNESEFIWDGNPTHSNSTIIMDAPNNTRGRYISVFELEDQFLIEISGTRIWSSPSTYNGSNVRAWVGIWQSGAATQFTSDPGDYGKSHCLWQGIPGTRFKSFSSHTHYICDVNELFNWPNGQVGTREFILQFIRVNDDIEVYQYTGGSFVLWRTFAIERPDEPLFFEFVETDSSSSANALTSYNYFDFRNIYNTSGSMSLFTFASPPDIYDLTTLYIEGLTPTSLSPLSIINRLTKTSDYNPQIIGTFTNVVNGVNIQLWDVTDGQNIPVTVVSSGCYQIGDTRQWGWSTINLPIYTGYSKQFIYLMTANNDETFDGQFFLSLPERSKWIHPSDSFIWG